MAATCPIGFDTERLREQVLRTYDLVARAPGGDFHFHRGARYAVELLRYDAGELAALPEAATTRFAGVGNPHRIGPIGTGRGRARPCLRGRHRSAAGGQAHRAHGTRHRC